MSHVVNSFAAYRTGGPVAPDSDIHLRFYFLSDPLYVSNSVDEKEADLDKVSDKDFLKNIAPDKKKCKYMTIRNVDLNII